MQLEKKIPCWIWWEDYYIINPLYVYNIKLYPLDITISTASFISFSLPWRIAPTLFHCLRQQNFIHSLLQSEYMVQIQYAEASEIKTMLLSWVNSRVSLKMIRKVHHQLPIILSLSCTICQCLSTGKFLPQFFILFYFSFFKYCSSIWLFKLRKKCGYSNRMSGC